MQHRTCRSVRRWLFRQRTSTYWAYLCVVSRCGAAPTGIIMKASSDFFFVTLRLFAVKLLIKYRENNEKMCETCHFVLYSGGLTSEMAFNTFATKRAGRVLTVLCILPYFGKRKQVTYHLNLSYWCFHILHSVLFFQAKFYASTLILLRVRDMLGIRDGDIILTSVEMTVHICSFTRNFTFVTCFILPN